jgi:hypothetical protein
MNKIKQKKKRIFLLAVSVIVLPVLVIFGLKFWGLGYKFSNEEDEINLQNPDFQIDVLNACGVEDVAFQITQYLRTKGFDVIDYGNYGSVVNESFIIDHVGKPDTAKLIAKVLGIDEKKIVNSKERYYNEFTVVIGKDYILLKPFKNKNGDGF